MASEGFGGMYEGIKWCRLRIYFCVVADSEDVVVTVFVFFSFRFYMLCWQSLIEGRRMY